MATSIEGSVLKALAPLATKAKQEGRMATMYLHLLPGSDDETVIEVTNGAHFMRVRVPGAVDEPLLLHQDDAKRLKGKEGLELSDNHITSPFQLSLIGTNRPQSGEDEKIKWPPQLAAQKVTGKAAFTIHPRRAAALLMAMSKLGITEVEVVLPKRVGAIIGFRGKASASEDDRVEAEGGFLPADMFHDIAPSPDEAPAAEKDE